jgi:hypothetical protein
MFLGAVTQGGVRSSLALGCYHCTAYGVRDRRAREARESLLGQVGSDGKAED